MNENGEDVFDKRLLSMVPGAVKFIVADVALQWVALACNIALFVVIGLFLQATLEGAADASMAIGVLAVSAVAIVVRMVCQTAAQRMGRKAASCAKCSIRQQVYDKLAALGPAYSETVATAVAVQVSVEGTEQLESYFGQYLPQLFYALLAPLTLFVALSPLSLPAAVALLVCVPLIPASIVCVQKIARRTMRNYWGSYTDLGSMFLEADPGPHDPQDLFRRRAQARGDERGGGELPQGDDAPAHDAAELDHHHGFSSPSAARRWE